MSHRRLLNGTCTLGNKFCAHVRGWLALSSLALSSSLKMMVTRAYPKENFACYCTTHELVDAKRPCPQTTCSCLQENSPQRQHLAVGVLPVYWRSGARHIYSVPEGQPKCSLQSASRCGGHSTGPLSEPRHAIKNSV